MSPFARQDDDPAGPHGRRQFRLVSDAVGQGAADEAPPVDGVLGMISPRFLVDLATWQERAAEADPARIRVRAEVPLVASLARIRSEADAALALTGVIELLARRFHVGLPCGDLDGEGFCFHAPAEVNLQSLAEAIDGVLLGTVRATDLQGALRDRARARVSRIEEGEDPLPGR